MSDLKQRLAKGQESAFVELYDQFGERIFTFVASRVSNRGFAEDIVQNVFERLIRYHRHFRQVENLKAYVFQVARNEIYRWSAVTSATSNGPDADSLPGNSNPNSQYDQQDWIEDVLAQLSGEDREIVSLKIFAELTFKELSIIFDSSAATVATRYRRAIGKLGTRIKERL